jgi:hypothetical protein
LPGEQEQTIRERAYAIWEEEGRPDGKALDHWLRAVSDDNASRSRWRDFWDKVFPVLVGGALAIVGSITGSYFATTFQMSAQLRAEKAAEQRKVFASLTGEKIVWEQLNISRANAWTAADYYQERWRRSGSPNTSLDVDEGKYWMHREADLVAEVTKSSQAVLADIANVRALFPDTPQLRELCNRVYTFQTMKTPNPPHQGSLDDLTQWKDETDRNVQKLAEAEYGKPIDDLLAYLLTQLPH